MKNGYIGSTGGLCVSVMTDVEICYVPREGEHGREGEIGRGCFVTDEAAEFLA